MLLRWSESASCHDLIQSNSCRISISIGWDCILSFEPAYQQTSSYGGRVDALCCPVSTAVKVVKRGSFWFCRSGDRFAGFDGPDFPWEEASWPHTPANSGVLQLHRKLSVSTLLLCADAASSSTTQAADGRRPRVASSQIRFPMRMIGRWRQTVSWISSPGFPVFGT